MVFNAGLPPPKVPLVLEEQAANLSRAKVRSPKSVAFPTDAIVIYSIVFVEYGDDDEYPHSTNTIEYIT